MTAPILGRGSPEEVSFIRGLLNQLGCRRAVGNQQPNAEHLLLALAIVRTIERIDHHQRCRESNGDEFISSR